jgi:hypothetical protein
MLAPRDRPRQRPALEPPSRRRAPATPPRADRARPPSPPPRPRLAARHHAVQGTGRRDSPPPDRPHRRPERRHRPRPPQRRTGERGAPELVPRPRGRAGPRRPRRRAPGRPPLLPSPALNSIFRTLLDARVARIELAVREPRSSATATPARRRPAPARAAPRHRQGPAAVAPPRRPRPPPPRGRGAQLASTAAGTTSPGPSELAALLARSPAYPRERMITVQLGDDVLYQQLLDLLRALVGGPPRSFEVAAWRPAAPRRPPRCPPSRSPPRRSRLERRANLGRDGARVSLQQAFPLAAGDQPRLEILARSSCAASPSSRPRSRRRPPASTSASTRAASRRSPPPASPRRPPRPAPPPSSAAPRTRRRAFACARPPAPVTIGVLSPADHRPRTRARDSRRADRTRSGAVHPREPSQRVEKCARASRADPARRGWTRCAHKPRPPRSADRLNQLMADDPSTASSYRTPAADGRSRPPHEHLAEFAVPSLGALRLELGLGAPIRLSLDREELRLTPGSGLRLRSDAPLPPLLSCATSASTSPRAELDLDATGLGGFEARAVSVALAAAFTHVLDWQPGRSLVDVAMQNLPQRADGRRRVSPAAPLSVWVDPDTRLDLTVTPEPLELSLSARRVAPRPRPRHRPARRPLPVRPQRLELEGPAGQPLRNALLRFVAWIASRWLRKRLPAALATPGYDPFADPARRAHFTELAARLGAAPAQKTAPRPAPPQPAPSDSQPAPSDSSAAPAPSDSHLPLRTPPRRRPDGLLARLRDLQRPPPQPRTLPPGARLLVVIPLGAHGSLALCTDKTAPTSPSSAAARQLTLDAPGGLYLHAEQAPGLERLQLAASPPTSARSRSSSSPPPPLGSFTAAAIQLVARALVASQAPARRPRAASPRSAPATSSCAPRPGKSGAGVTSSPPRAAEEIVLRHGPDALEPRDPRRPPARFPGSSSCPTPRSAACATPGPPASSSSTPPPSSASSATSFVTQLCATAPPRTSRRLLGFRGPDASPPIDPTIAAARPAVAFVETTASPARPPERPLDPADRIDVSLSPPPSSSPATPASPSSPPSCSSPSSSSSSASSPGTRPLRRPRPRRLRHPILTTPPRELRPRPPAPAPPRLGQTPTSPAPGSSCASPPARVGPIALNLAAGGAIVLERSGQGLELRVDPFLEIRPEKPDYLPEARLPRSAGQPATDAWILEFEPAVGPLVGDLVQHLVHKPRPARAARQRRQTPRAPRPDPRHRSRPRRPSPGTVVYETDRPKLGNLRVAADPRHTVDLELTRKAVDITLGAGVAARLPGSASTSTSTACASACARSPPTSRQAPRRPAVRPRPRARPARPPQASTPTPSGPPASPPASARTPSSCPRPRQPPGVRCGLRPDRRRPRRPPRPRRPRAPALPAGVFISGQAIDWLPDFYLHTSATPSRPAP